MKQLSLQELGTSDQKVRLSIQRRAGRGERADNIARACIIDYYYDNINTRRCPALGRSFIGAVYTAVRYCIAVTAVRTLVSSETCQCTRLEALFLFYKSRENETDFEPRLNTNVDARLCSKTILLGYQRWVGRD